MNCSMAENISNISPAWVRVKAAAQRSSVCERTMWDWLKTGKIRYSKVGAVVLIECAELDRFLRSQTVESAADKIVNAMH